MVKNNLTTFIVNLYSKCIFVGYKKSKKKYLLSVLGSRPCEVQTHLLTVNLVSGELACNNTSTTACDTSSFHSHLVDFLDDCHVSTSNATRLCRDPGSCGSFSLDIRRLPNEGPFKEGPLLASVLSRGTLVATQLRLNEDAVLCPRSSGTPDPICFPRRALCRLSSGTTSNHAGSSFLPATKHTGN